MIIYIFTMLFNFYNNSIYQKTILRRVNGLDKQVLFRSKERGMGYQINLYLNYIFVQMANRVSLNIYKKNASYDFKRQIMYDIKKNFRTLLI